MTLGWWCVNGIYPTWPRNRIPTNNHLQRMGLGRQCFPRVSCIGGLRKRRSRILQCRWKLLKQRSKLWFGPVHHRRQEHRKVHDFLTSFFQLSFRDRIHPHQYYSLGMTSYCLGEATSVFATPTTHWKTAFGPSLSTSSSAPATGWTWASPPYIKELKPLTTSM